MSASENKELMAKIFSGLSRGDTAPFLDALADDVRWTIAGTGRWSRTYHGLEAVRNELLAPLFANFADKYASTAHRLIAEDDLVTVEAAGRVTTTRGEPYHNNYCFIFRLADGRVKEITEYCDTELIAKTLGGGVRESAAPAVSSGPDSVLAILRLYEIRREEKMRAARAWFSTEFWPQSMADIINLYRDGAQASANFRMVTSYWDMAASFVVNGGIDEKMFLDANTEHVFVYAKIQPFLAEIRQLIGEPDYLVNLEKLIARVPNIESKLETRKRLAAVWSRADKKELSAAESN